MEKKNHIDFGIIN